MKTLLELLIPKELLPCTTFHSVPLEGELTGACGGCAHCEDGGIVCSGAHLITLLFVSGTWRIAHTDLIQYKIDNYDILGLCLLSHPDGYVRY